MELFYVAELFATFYKGGHTFNVTQTSKATAGLGHRLDVTLSLQPIRLLGDTSPAAQAGARRWRIPTTTASPNLPEAAPLPALFVPRPPRLEHPLRWRSTTAFRLR